MKICFIGCGTMGKGLSKALSDQHEIHLYNRSPQKIAPFAEEIGAKNFDQPKEAIADVDMIVLAVKPGQLKDVAFQIADYVKKGQIVVSILAGVTTADLEHHFGQVPLVAAMPNVGCFTGHGVFGIADTDGLSQETRRTLETTFGPLGRVIWVPEDSINALGAIVGSGPAFVMVLIEAISEAGIHMGIKSDLAQELALELLKSSSEMVQSSDRHPAQWKTDVCSPGGATIGGLRVLEEEGVKSGLIETFLETFDRFQS